MASFFGLSGSHNDIKVLHLSPLFAKLAEDQAVDVNFSINCHNYSMGYYHTDVIYPGWVAFVKSISQPREAKRTYFTKAQKAARMDVEHAFRVLQSHFALGNIMKAYVIMYNMIVENERVVDHDEHFSYEEEKVQLFHKHYGSIAEFFYAYTRIMGNKTHH